MFFVKSANDPTTLYPYPLFFFPFNGPKNDIIIEFIHILFIFSAKLRVREWI